MSSDTGRAQTGRKIWYGTAIALSVLVMLLSLVGVVGAWVAGSALTSVTRQVLVVVENTAGGLSAVVERLDQGAERLEETSTQISAATRQLSQNVTDKGLVLTLLPEEREQELVAQAGELQQTLDSIRDTLTAGLELYRSIDSLPFVSLPRPDPQTISNLEDATSQTRESVQQVVQGIQDFRSGVSQEIGRVTALVEQVTARLQEARQDLAQLNTRLEALQALAQRLQRSVALLFTSLSVLVTLSLAWVIYGQVELIRLYSRRWKELGEAVEDDRIGDEGLEPVLPDEQGIDDGDS